MTKDELPHQSNLWLGSMNGLHAVFDPSIQVEQSRWVIIYIALRKRLIPYEKSHGRSIWKDFAGDDEDADRLRRDYLGWRADGGDAHVAAAIELIRQNDVVTDRRLAEAENRHKARLEKSSKRYRGITEPDGLGLIRNAVCHDCHRVLGSEAHLQCNGCHWIVCSHCGACGCTSYPKT
jgi:hypothetical protein